MKSTNTQNVNFQGNLSGVSLPTLLQMIGSDRKTGVLYLYDAEIQRNLFFVDGKFSFIISDEPRDLLGHFLVHRKIITEEQLLEALKIQKETNERLGDIIIEISHLCDEKLKEQLVHKTKESFFQIFLLQEADFAFRDEDFSEKNYPIQFSFEVAELTLEGLGRKDEFEELQKRFLSSWDHIRITGELPKASLKNQPLLQSVYEGIQNNLTLPELCYDLHSYEYPIYKALQTLLEMQVIQTTPKPSHKMQSRSIVKDLLARAQKESSQGKLESALMIYKDILLLDPNNEQAFQAKDQIDSKLTPEPEHRSLAKNAIFNLQQNINLNDLALTSTEGFLLSRINGQWTVEEILSVIPMTEKQGIASFNRLIDLGIIKPRM